MDFKKEAELFQKGVLNVCHADIDFVRKSTGETHLSNIQIASWIVFTRWEKPECDFCHQKASTRCSRCWYSWYCSKSCQEKHWSIHKLRCGNKNGPLDEWIKTWIEGWQQESFPLQSSKDKNPDENETKKKLDNILKDEKKFQLFMFHAQEKKFFSFTQIIPGYFVMLLFSSTKAILGTYNNHLDKEDGCFSHLVDKKQLLDLLPLYSHAFLQKFDEEKNWGVIVASIGNSKECEEKVVIHFLNYYNLHSPMNQDTNQDNNQDNNQDMNQDNNQDPI